MTPRVYARCVHGARMPDPAFKQTNQIHFPRNCIGNPADAVEQYYLSLSLSVSLLPSARQVTPQRSSADPRRFAFSTYNHTKERIVPRN